MPVGNGQLQKVSKIKKLHLILLIFLPSLVLADLGEFVMGRTRTLPSNFRLFGLVLCGLVLSACSQEPEVVTGPFVIRNQIIYSQDSDQPVTGIIEEFYDSGSVESRKTYRDGILHGPMETFYENGQLENRSVVSSQTYWPIGLSETFYENGQLETSSDFQSDSFTGPFYLYYEDGSLKNTRFFQDGRRDGMWSFFREGYFYPDSTTDFNFSREETCSVIYRERKKYVNDYLLFTPDMIDDESYGFSDNDHLITAEDEGFRHCSDWTTPFTGYAEWFHDNGQVAGFYELKAGRITGESSSFYENGVMEATGNYINGVEHGLHQYFNENGELTKTETWENGELVEENDNP